MKRTFLLILSISMTIVMLSTSCNTEQQNNSETTQDETALKETETVENTEMITPKTSLSTV